MCDVNFYNINTVPQSKVGGLITILSPERLTAVSEIINFVLGID